MARRIISYTTLTPTAYSDTTDLVNGNYPFFIQGGADYPADQDPRDQYLGTGRFHVVPDVYAVRSGLPGWNILHCVVLERWCGYGHGYRDCGPIRPSRHRQQCHDIQAATLLHRTLDELFA